MIKSIHNLLEQELQFEKKLFFFLNKNGCTFFDYFFWLCSSTWIEICTYISCVCFFLKKKSYKTILLEILSIILVFFVCHVTSSFFFKPIFHRFRPSYHPFFKTHVNIIFEHIKNPYGFISSHTTNAFGFAIFTSLIFRNHLYTWMILLFACIIGYSRIYLGAHFILDVIIGIFVGLLLGYLVYNLYKYIKHIYIK
ncbi:MAG: phosphatase PAP2 family protein [Bacteroidales bacterium OttesenSCG-928-I14]|jgi:undecaprenyl-diphosphatase|nr:phosphatase PAP2 family protein [Bacteroidales bacterium OttesenSCG-928-I14]